MKRQSEEMTPNTERTRSYEEQVVQRIKSRHALIDGDQIVLFDDPVDQSDPWMMFAAGYLLAERYHYESIRGSQCKLLDAHMDQGKMVRNE